MLLRCVVRSVSCNNLLLQASRAACQRYLFSSSSITGPSTGSENLAGSFQNPIVEQLWATREQAKQRHAESVESSADNPYSSFETARPPSLSSTSIIYPFSTNAFLRESYASPWGQVRFGRMLEDLDACAGNIAFKHCVCEGSWEAPLIVTAGVDRIIVGDRPLPQVDMKLTGSISWVGSSSMEITMKVGVLDDPTQDEPSNYWLEAKFTFVARNQATNKATSIVALAPESEEEFFLFEQGAEAARRKKEMRVQLATASAYTLEVERMGNELLAQSASLLQMPSLAPSHLILMSQTQLHNALIAQPQQRNMHNRIFGGFLMRRAFELAFATAYVFGGCRPKFIEVDDISFLAPVDVGELLVFHSRVLYSLPDGGKLRLAGDSPLVMVEVETWVTEPEKVTSKLSNKFHFTFALLDQTTCKTVVPSNLAEGKRMAARMLADEMQAGLLSE